ncbi:MAG: formate/nitrite transporter family protein [Collinsella stercoris]|uniref:formate/nitrite transporter family protein n=1 Tax=Collinsella stercoris TaxID=147206 RepID=UPI0039917A64
MLLARDSSPCRRVRWASSPMPSHSPRPRSTLLTAFARGVLCNVLVCLGVWMGSAGKTVCDKLAATILPVVSPVVLGFEHSVANMFFLPFGVAAQSMLGVGAILLAGMVSNHVRHARQH